MKELEKDFNSKCGEILRMALSIEEWLDIFICRYFCQSQNYKTSLLNELVLLDVGFGRKVDIFKAICIKENFDRKEINKIMSSINSVKKMRNKVAHEAPVVNYPTDGRIQIPPRKYGQKALELTEELMKQIEKNKSDAVNGIIKIYLALSDPIRKTREDNTVFY